MGKNLIYTFFIFCTIVSCRTVKEKNEQLDYQREQSYSNWQRQQAQLFQFTDSAGRYWIFQSDTTFGYHPDSGLRASSGTLGLWEHSVQKQVWSSTLDSNRTEVRASEKINSWSQYYRKVKDSKWGVVMAVFLLFGMVIFVYRKLKI